MVSLGGCGVFGDWWQITWEGVDPRDLGPGRLVTAGLDPQLQVVSAHPDVGVVAGLAVAVTELNHTAEPGVQLGGDVFDKFGSTEFGFGVHVLCTFVQQVDPLSGGQFDVQHVSVIFRYKDFLYVKVIDITGSHV